MKFNKIIISNVILVASIPLCANVNFWVTVIGLVKLTIAIILLNNGFYIDNAIDPNSPAGRKTGAEVTVELGSAAALSLFVASTGFGGGI